MLRTKGFKKQAPLVVKTTCGIKCINNYGKLKRSFRSITALKDLTGEVNISTGLHAYQLSVNSPADA